MFPLSLHSACTLTDLCISLRDAVLASGNIWKLCANICDIFFARLEGHSGDKGGAQRVLRSQQLVHEVHIPLVICAAGQRDGTVRLGS